MGKKNKLNLVRENFLARVHNFLNLIEWKFSIEEGINVLRY